MKKPLILLTIAVVIFAGVVVGKITNFDNSGPQSKGEKLAVVDRRVAPQNDGFGSEPNADLYSSKGGSNKVANGSKTQSLDEPSSQSETSSNSPKIGDPKSTKIVKQGTLEIEVKENKLAEAITGINKALSNGAYIETTDRLEDSATITVRIPSKDLDSTLEKIRKLGDVNAESITSADKSFEYIDMEARLNILQQKEQSTLRLLDSVKDPYQIQYLEEQLFNTREQIDIAEGQMRHLDDQVAYSTITIDLVEKDSAAAKKEDPSILAKSWNTAVSSLLASAGGVLIVLLAISPYLLIIATGYLVFTRVRNKRKASTAIAE